MEYKNTLWKLKKKKEFISIYIMSVTFLNMKEWLTSPFQSALKCF